MPKHFGVLLPFGALVPSGNLPPHLSLLIPSDIARISL